MAAMIASAGSRGRLRWRPIARPIDTLDMMPLDELRMVSLSRRLVGPREADPTVAVRREIDCRDLLAGLEPGAELAIAVGSRAIAHYPEVIRAAVLAARERALRPVLIAAMGSHGGGTARGQLQTLMQLGLDSRQLGVPVDTSMKTVVVGRLGDGTPVHTAARVVRADGILLINRVKRHTSFDGGIGSGLCKMLGVGLGKRAGAAALHAAGLRQGLASVIVEAARILLAAMPVVGGLALVENGRCELAQVVGLGASRLPLAEQELLVTARRLCPGLDLDDLDLLVVDRIGKDISGTGMDPWVIGRLLSSYEQEPASPRITRVYARSLSRRSAGNGHGVGLADLVHRRLASAIDWELTATNALAAGAPQKARLPLVMNSDRESLGAALACAGVVRLAQARVVRVADTAALETVEVSSALVPEALAVGYRLPAGARARPWRFDGHGDLAWPPQSA